MVIEEARAGEREREFFEFVSERGGGRLYSSSAAAAAFAAHDRVRVEQGDDLLSSESERVFFER